MTGGIEMSVQHSTARGDSGHSGHFGVSTSEHGGFCVLFFSLGFWVLTKNNFPYIDLNVCGFFFRHDVTFRLAVYFSN